MSDTQRKKPVGRQPLTRHPLFPAIVALWFGALFGLGSLAIRPALIEQLVVAGGIDSVIPMAAPPLGVTTRILMALAMTGLGGLIGGLIAHQISRPKQEKRERRRAPRPAGAQEATSATASSAMAAAPRRRALAMQEDNTPAEPCDLAPVPGHSARILDVTEFELDGFEELGDEDPVADHDHGALPDEATVERLPAFLATHEEATDAVTAGEHQGEPSEEPAASVSIPDDAQVFTSTAPLTDPKIEADKTEAMEDLAQPRPVAFENSPNPKFGQADDRQVFEAPAPAHNFAAPAPAHNGAAFEAPTAETSRSSLNNRLFEAYSREIAARAERASDAGSQPLFNRHPSPETPAASRATLLPRLSLGDWDETELSDTQDDAPEHHEPLFPRKLSMADAADVSAPVEFESNGEDVVAASFETENSECAASAFEPQADEHPVETGSWDAVGDEPDSAGETRSDIDQGDIDAATAAERIASSKLDELSPVELLERLAMSMARRRLRGETAPAAELAAELAAEPDSSENVPLAPIPNPWSDILPASADATDDVEADEVEFEAEYAEAEEFLSDAPEPELPAAVRPVPAALRPVSFEPEGDADELPGYVPPRSIGIGNTSPTVQAPALSGNDEVDDEDDDDDALEEGYSSLLNLSRPFERSEFVRIDEPEVTREIQSFVMFPGEESRDRLDQHENGAPAHDVAATDDRPFDPPPVVDPRAEAEESERKLRAALANLQRISGAA